MKNNAKMIRLAVKELKKADKKNVPWMVVVGDAAWSNDAYDYYLQPENERG